MVTKATRHCEHCEETISVEAEACPACGRLYTPVPCPGSDTGSAPGQCVICGTPVCGEQKLRKGDPYRCETHEEVPVYQGWAQVYSASTDLQADLVSENLRAEGVDSRILSQKDHFFAPVDLGDLSPVRVLVPAYSFMNALEVIDSHRDEKGEVRFACPECGEPLEPESEACLSCGAVQR